MTDLPEFAESAIFFAIEPSHLFFDIITKIQIRSFSLRYTFPENLPYFLPSLLKIFLAVQLCSSRACTLSPSLPLLCARSLSVLSARHAKLIGSW